MQVATLPAANRLTRRLFRLGERDTLPLTLGARRVYILPTRQGVVFGLLLLGMLVGAINYGISLGFLFTFLLAGMGLACLFATWRNVLGLRPRAVEAEPVFAGERLTLRLRLDPPGDRPRRGIVLRRGGDAAAPVDLAADRDGVLQLSLETRQRGRLALGTLEIGSDEPLGLFRAWAVLRPDTQALVWPRPAAGHPPLPVAESETGEHDGAPGRGVEDFDGLRAYAPGESLSRLAWKTLARHEAPLVKDFVSPAGRRLWLDWARLGGRDPEARVALLSRWVLDADAAGQPWGLRLPGLTLPQGSGRAQRVRCLNALAVHGLESAPGTSPSPSRRGVGGEGERRPRRQRRGQATVSPSPQPSASRGRG